MSGRLEQADVNPFLRLLEERAPRPLSVPEMARMLDVERFSPRALRVLLDAEVERGRLRRIGKTRYQWRRESDGAPAAKGTRLATSRSTGERVPGHYSRVRAGYGFVTVLGRAADRFPRDVLIPNGAEGAALHGDRVVVEITGRDPRRRRTVGRIAEVSAPVHERLLGVLESTYHGWVVVPDSELLPPIAIAPTPLPPNLERGRYVLVRLTQPGSALTPHRGVIEQVLGDPDDPEVQFLQIATEHGLRTEFPPDVISEADRLSVDPDPRDFEGRRDLRELPLVTIDGETARDFDDAVHVASEGEGFRVWVAIADVGHYVREGSALDREAATRGNSVYFPDRAIPMLPPRLSTELCSLNAGRDRLVLVAEVGIDRSGEPGDVQIYRAVMRSWARLTYTEVAAALAGEPVREEVGACAGVLRRMREIMHRLYRRRRAAGSIDLDLPEALIDLSEDGRSVGVRLLQRNDAHRIIEELMLVANQAVARKLREVEIPLAYRIHEPPESDDIDELNAFLGPFGLRVEYRGPIEPRDVQRLLDRLADHPLARVLSRQVLRSLTQAQYSTRNAGHFGLAFPVYCHFTSPIRRYPDLLVHRQLGRWLDGESEVARAAADAIEVACVSSSQTERTAMAAERAMADLKKAEFMRDHLREPGPGTIVSVTPFGFYVELDAYPVEGLVRLDALDDSYEFVESERALYGARRRQRFRLGDRVEVEAIDVSLRRRTIDFALVGRLGRTVQATEATRP